MPVLLCSSLWDQLGAAANAVRKICSLRRKQRCPFSPFSAWPTAPYSKGSMPLRNISVLGLKLQLKANRSKLFCWQLPLCQVQKKLAGQKSAGLIIEKAACKQAQPKTPFSPSQISFPTFLLLEGLPIYLPYLYSILLYSHLIQDQHRRSNSLLSLVDSNATWNLLSVDDSPVAAAEQ